MKRFFSYGYLTSKSDTCFKSKAGVPISRYVVYCTDIPGLIAWKKLLEDDFDNEYMNIIGLDDGKSILKICWNWSKSEVDEGKYKLMGPKRSIIWHVFVMFLKPLITLKYSGTYVGLIILSIYYLKISNCIILLSGSKHTHQNIHVHTVMAIIVQKSRDESRVNH